MDTTNETARRSALVDAVARRLRAPSFVTGVTGVTARLGRRASGVKPILPGAPLPAHRRVLTT